VIVKLKYLVEDRDRHGNVRCYVRVRGQPKIRLRGMPGTPEFMVAYQAALAGDTVSTGELNRRQQYHLSPVGSFGHACLAYYASAEFKGLDEKTQHWRRAALDKICQAHGHRLIATIQPKHVRALRNELAATPAAADQRLRALKALFRWAVENDMVANNPTRDVKKAALPTEGHHSWTPNEIEQYKTRHPIGSKARLAMALILFTAARREDVIRFGAQHVRDGRLRYTQAKNEHRKPNHMDIPVHAELARIIAATPSRHLTFLVSERGRPFSVGTFGKAMRKWCDEAGLSHCTAHGLRYATAAYLAEQGASAHEIMAITGHRSLAEVERYTKAANKTRLADSAIARIKNEQ
jgi:site-specific recombinase XerD